MKNPAITTGPLLIPAKMSGDANGTGPDWIFFPIKNPTSKELTVELFVEVCPADPNKPDYTVSSGDLKVPCNSCLRNIAITGLKPGDILRIVAKGDISIHGEKIELSVVGVRISDRMNEPTLYVPHGDFIKTHYYDQQANPLNNVLSMTQVHFVE
ncbi:hypothetical protein II5_00479 [Bacillus cereus MSX-A1]|uniref:hypothetical protein n=1 Tax=Bacillus cereus TaxID=1396 RepID=UPI000279738E|nr:hypothetical protein [Bacillus cereus]EJR09176.1 hypothetical protein II5_00479 [Bacillus cereus MSX-A1]MDR4289259.1 hypothetical protein [Bacillus cereus]